jgi:uncharacterized protein
MSRSIASGSTGERIVVVDAVRGFALLGIVVAHMVEQYLGSPPPPSIPNFGVFSAVDQIALAVDQLLVVGKFFTIFSLLFGLSFFIQMERGARRGTSFAGRFAWRLAVLFVIGILHHLFYRGDILTIYALLGVLLIPFYRASDRTLLVVAFVLLFGVPRLLLAAADPVFGVQVPMLSLEDPRIEEYFTAIKSGWLPNLFWVNLRDGFWLKLEFLFTWFGRGYQTIGLFLLGLYIGRHGWHERVEEVRRPLKGLTFGGLGAAVLAVAVLGALVVVVGPPQSPSEIKQWHLLVGLTLLDVVNVGLSAFLMGSFVLLYRSTWFHGALRRLAPVGQTALTTYVCQTLIGTFILYGYGLNLIGEIGAATAMLLAVVVFLIQAFAATMWLRHFQYGPLEWVWRSATFARLAPFRKVPAPAPATV